MWFLISPLFWTAAILASFLYSVDVRNSIDEDREASWKALGEIARVKDAELNHTIMEAELVAGQSELRELRDLSRNNPTINLDALQARLDGWQKKISSGKESVESQMEFAELTLSAVEQRIETKRRNLEIAEWVRLILTLAFGGFLALHAARRWLPAT